MSALDYKPVFDTAQSLAEAVDYRATFPEFHDYRSLYHFIVAPEGQQGPDKGALRDAEEIDAALSRRLAAKGPSLLGNGSKTLDGVESRHIAVLTALLAQTGASLGNVVEIGGGYGNCLRLLDGIAEINSWTIIDMPYILDLQRWFLHNAGVERPVLYLPADSPDEYAELWPDIVIGIHSLSEISAEDFEVYYEGLIRRSPLLYYVSQVSGPSDWLIREKLAIIRTDFDLRYSRLYEGGNSVIQLFENRSV